MNNNYDITGVNYDVTGVNYESSNDNRNSFFDLSSLTEPPSSISLRSNGEDASKAIESPTH